MKAGDIIFVRGKSPLSNLVKFFDKGEFSHVAIAISSTHVLEADWYIRTRVREMNYEDVEVVDLGLTEEERDLIVHAGIQLIGKWYDYKQILWYVLKRFFSLKGKNKFNSPNNLICSEVIFYILAELGMVDCVTGLDFDVTPNQLYKYMTNLKKVGCE
jgi:hypothetical protein